MSVPAYLVTEDDTSTEGMVVENYEFYPDIQLSELSQRYQIDDTYTPSRQFALLKAAVIETNKALREQLRAWHVQGFNKLEDVFMPEIDETQDWVTVYENAVFSYCMHSLTERYQATDSTEYAVRKSSEKNEKSTAVYFNEYRRYLMMFTGQSVEVSCELI